MAPQATALPIKLRTQLQKSDLNRHILPYEGSVLPSPRHSAIGVQRFELWTSRSQTERATKLRHTPKWNGFVLLLPSASTFIEGISRDLAPVYYPPYGHSSSFCGTLLQGLSTTYVSHLPFLILYKYYNKIFIKNQLNNFAIFLLVATPTY